MMRSAFSDIRYDPQDIIAEGDKVVVRSLVSGTNDGPFMGMDRTDNRVTWNEIDIVRFEKGKVVEHWGQYDMLGLLQQLGFISIPEMAPIGAR